MLYLTWIGARRSLHIITNAAKNLCDDVEFWSWSCSRWSQWWPRQRPRELVKREFPVPGNSASFLLSPPQPAPAPPPPPQIYYSAIVPTSREPRNIVIYYLTICLVLIGGNSIIPSAIPLRLFVCWNICKQTSSSSTNGAFESGKRQLELVENVLTMYFVRHDALEKSRPVPLRQKALNIDLQPRLLKLCADYRH